jgi:ribosomal protein S18 acetylase RimI-like enzyme
MLQFVRPDTNQFEQALQLRYRVLRAPHGMPKGTETDNHEAGAIHVVAIEGGRVIGTGRGNNLGKGIYQVRFMATDPDQRSRGVGRGVLQKIEELAQAEGGRAIELNARISAQDFYTKQGYQIIGTGPIMFDDIEHVIMRKQLT